MVGVSGRARKVRRGRRQTAMARGFGPADRNGDRGVGGAVGAAREARRAAVGAGRAAVRTRTRRGPDSAFMARCAHGRRCMAASQRQRADERARRGERD
jgi:hypothetical protein